MLGTELYTLKVEFTLLQAEYDLPLNATCPTHSIQTRNTGITLVMQLKDRTHNDGYHKCFENYEDTCTLSWGGA